MRVERTRRTPYSWQSLNQQYQRTITSGVLFLIFSVVGVRSRFTVPFCDVLSMYVMDWLSVDGWKWKVALATTHVVGNPSLWQHCSQPVSC